ncbi:unnamed protein product [Vicia faba]|uniref:Uncharacterized protein n=1 Tax=Vicia faba TaxID=3906 RepID=A0AAV0Z996_VICFA|nr:unnamed protein product [Vicia faba]
MAPLRRDKGKGKVINNPIVPKPDSLNLGRLVPNPKEKIDFTLTFRNKTLTTPNFHGESRFQMTPKEYEVNIEAANKNMGNFKDKDGIFKHKEDASSTFSLVPMSEEEDPMNLQEALLSLDV